MKKLLIGIGLSLGLVVGNIPAANIFSTNIASGGVLTKTNWLLTGQYQISSLTVLSISAGTVYFYDTVSTNLVYTNNSFTARATPTNYTLTTITTNSVGIRQTQTWTGIYTYTNTTAASTSNAVPAFAAISVPANTSVTLPVNVNTSLGVMTRMDNNTNTVISITYAPAGTSNP